MSSTAAASASALPALNNVLATAWVTLGDVLGRDVAESWVAPILEAYRMKWGSEGFATAKAQHDARRKAAIRSAREAG